MWLQIHYIYVSDKAFLIRKSDGQLFYDFHAINYELKFWLLNKVCKIQKKFVTL